MALGEFGIWTTYGAIGEPNAAEAAQLVESLGYGTFWLGGSPRLPSVRPLLASTEHLIVATGVVNVWQYDPGTLAGEYAQLDRDHPGRVVLGIGVGHPERTGEYARPLATMSDFFDGLDGAPAPVAREARCAAALGPLMLDLCARRSLGTLTYFTPVEHTRFARERLGAGALVATELACVLDADPERERTTARGYAEAYLRMRNYTTNLRRFGFGDADVAGAGSDRLIDTVVPHGTAAEIAAVARAHLAAGADHVCLQPVGVSGVPRAEWSALAAALELGG